MEDKLLMKILPITAIMLLAMSSSALAVTTTPSPVKVTGCTVMFASSGNSIGVPGVTLTNGVTITLANESGRLVKSVTVSGNYHGRHETGTAAWDFKPGTTAMITRHFTQSAYVDPNAQCTVTSVTFGDGTTWP
jgi:hypothetical protein